MSSEPPAGLLKIRDWKTFELSKLRLYILLSVNYIIAECLIGKDAGPAPKTATPK